MFEVQSNRSSTRFKAVTIFLTGIIVHILYLSSVFDVYFTSPLVSGVPALPKDESREPPARRLVLFVADGLRADKFLNALHDNSEAKASYFLELIEERGTWGVAHTRVPTETRPGHVALISGFYEDVAAITKGWKENPVEFDSIFNQSRYTWAFGAPDVIQMFTMTEGIKGRIFSDCFSAEFIDFATKNATQLDFWTYQHFSDLLAKANSNKELKQQLQQDKIVFFLHFLGLDVHGHSVKPSSANYKANIKYVDEIIKRVESEIETFYDHDGKTAYLFSSDHGMTDWGSHGSGLPSETLVPMLAWGAGIQRPKHGDPPLKFTDDLPDNWNKKHIVRNDIEQADVSALMAGLIGLSYPVNSVGILPVNYLNADDKMKAVYLLENARQILEQYIVKEKLVKEKSFWFTPFQLTAARRSTTLASIDMDLKDGHFLRAMTQTRDLAKLALEGLQYYHKYNRLYLSAVMAVGFLGWIINILLELAEDRKQNLAECTRSSKKMLRGIRFVFGMAVCVVLILLYLHAAPAMHYMYCLLPFPLWYNILIKRRAIAGLCAWRVHSSKTWLLIRRSLTTIILIEIMTLAFFHRWVLSILLVAGAILSFVIVYRRTGHLLSMRCCLWSAALLVMAIFPLLPVISGNENYALVALAGLFSGAVGLSYTFLFPPKSRSEAVPLIATVAIVLCTALRLHTAHSVHSGFGLPKLNQLLSWTLLTILPFLPLWSKPMLIERLLCIFLSLVSVYILTSIYYEAFFFVCLTITMFLWIWIEKFFVDLKIADSFIGLTQNSQTNVAYNEDNHELDVLDHFRISNEFIFFILLAFFGTGNISSVNSFDPASLYCLVTIFSPFVMGAILIFKVLLPFLLVSCCFNAMRSVIKIDIRRIFLAVLASTDLMAINFFFRIRDEGSWLEIGSSLSHFIIVLSFIFFLFPIFELGGLFFFNIQRDGVKTHQF